MFLLAFFCIDPLHQHSNLTERKLRAGVLQTCLLRRSKLTLTMWIMSSRGVICNWWWLFLELGTTNGLIVARRSGSLSPSSLSSPSDTGEAAALLPIVQVSFPLSWHCQTLLYRIHVYYTVSVDLLNDMPSLRLKERDWGSETRS